MPSKLNNEPADFTRINACKEKILDTLFIILYIILGDHDMEEKITQGYLYDFYGELLNEHQKKIYEAFVYDDLSLSEIAEQEGISRQGVHDLIRRCTKSLETYETKLHLVEKFIHIRDRVGDIQKLTSEADASDPKILLENIRQISDGILEEL